MTTSITGQGITACKAPDDALSNESKNAVQNKVINGEVTDLQRTFSQTETSQSATKTKLKRILCAIHNCLWASVTVGN